MKRVLITGASGFIGKHLVNALSATHEVLSLTSKNSSIENKGLLKLFENNAIDHIFHLAALNFVPESWSKPYDYLSVNILGTSNVLELCRRHKSRLTYISSYLYGAPQSLPIAENAQTEALNPYALSKLTAEKVVSFYSQNYDIASTVIRPFNIYGPGQKKDFLIPTLVGQALESGVIAVNDTRPKRDYVYIDDFIEALALTIDLQSKHEIINVGSGESYSIQTVVHTIESLIGKPIQLIDKGLARPNEIFDVVADISKASAVLGWKPRTSLRNGLERIITEWQKD